MKQRNWENETAKHLNETAKYNIFSYLKLVKYDIALFHSFVALCFAVSFRGFARVSFFGNVHFLHRKVLHSAYSVYKYRSRNQEGTGHEGTPPP